MTEIEKKESWDSVFQRYRQYNTTTPILGSFLKVFNAIREVCERKYYVSGFPKMFLFNDEGNWTLSIGPDLNNVDVNALDTGIEYRLPGKENVRVPFEDIPATLAKLKRLIQRPSKSVLREDQY